VIFDQFCSNTKGTTAVEFGITAPVFVMVIFGILECGTLLWTQLGLQHGTQMAARCASINSSNCGNPTDIQAYAALQAYGLAVSPSVFTASTSACGNQVSASYTYQFVSSYFGAPSLTLTAQSCFPS
jgi:Flp pilus assembly protein TadG